MPILTLKFKQNVVEQYSLDKGKSITIGRMDKNDIVIANLAVSGFHAKIDTVDEGYLLTDLQSKNGSFVNDKIAASHWLQHGDVITIGKHNIIFTYGDEEKKPDSNSSPSNMDQTMVMDTDSYRDMLSKSAPGMVPSHAAKKEPTVVLSYLAGGEGEVEISKKLIKIGKDSSCDIVVSGLTVGQTAATISKKPSGYSLSYVSGMAKPKVNGETVKTSIDLKEFDVIELGSAKLNFFIKE